MESSELTKTIADFALKHGLGKNREFKYLYNLITSSSRRDRYFGLMGVFELDIHRNNLLVQTFAGRLLLKIKPKPFESCEEALFRLLPNWNVSAEEVIFYLSEQFSKDVVILAVNSLKKGHLSESDTASLKSILFWLGCNER